MTSERYVLTGPLQAAVKGRETEVLAALKIAWQRGGPHIRCPYPDHADENPSWRWDEGKARAFCTCTERSHSIFDVVMRVEGLDFEAAKLRVAEILGRRDLIETKDGRHQAMDAASLLQPPADQRDETLGPCYLGHRLGVPPETVPMPSSSVVGWRELPYYDGPGSNEKKPCLVGRFPCVVFATVAPDGRRHAHRIYVASGGRGKAELGTNAKGHPRDPKKSACLREGQNATGCVVFWGDPANASHLLVAEGIETAAALAFALQAEIEAGEIMVAAALSTSGIMAFLLWPATRKVTIAADRDEDRPPDDRGFKAGEKAARAFARAHYERLEVRIALPGAPGEEVDWLDVLRGAGAEAVRVGIAGARPFEMAADAEAGLPDADAPAEPDQDDGESTLGEIVIRAKVDPSTPFEPKALATLVAVRRDDPPGYQRTISALKQAGVRMRDLERELRRAGFRVIEGGSATTATDAAVAAGSYFVTSTGMIAWRKETRDGSVAIPLCNFTAQIVAQEVIDDGAERRTVLAIEGAMPNGRRLPCARVSAERFPSMSWVTEAWGTAPVIFAGQGKKDHLRAAIQMLSGDAPTRTIYGHLGWRSIGDHWAFLYSGGAIGPNGAIDGIEVDTGSDLLLNYQLPAPPGSSELAVAVRASLGLLELAPGEITAPVLGATYRAPLAEPSPVDFSLHLTGPTGVFKSELAAVAQAHFGPGFNSRRLPASWADTANMLEKKAFLAKDVVLVVDDFAPAGTTTDVQRLHREADRLFRGAGNRSGRARMRADGTGRPTYHCRGLVVSTGEDIPSGQSLRARMLVLDLTPGDIDPAVLSLAQRNAFDGVLAKAMAGYLRWLAPRIDDLRRTLPERQRALRDEFVRQGQHKRTPEVAASIMIGWETFLGFAEDVGALPHHSVEPLLERVRAAVLDSAATQAGHQSSEEPAARFLALLGATISSGRAHVAGAGDGGAPDEADRWGWQMVVVGAGNQEREDWRPRGERIGWLDADDLFLDPESSFAAVQKLARDQGTSVPIKQRTLWKRLAEQGHLGSRDRARGTNTVRRTIGGRRLEVIHLKTSTFAVETDQRDDTDQEKGPESRRFPGCGQFGQFGQKTEHRGRDERDLRDAVGWEVEI